MVAITKLGHLKFGDLILADAAPFFLSRAANLRRHHYSTSNLKFSTSAYSSSNFSSINNNNNHPVTSANNTNNCSTNPPTKWQICSAVLLERFPLIAPPMNDIERQFSELMEKLEFENSLLSEHELRSIADKKRLERLEKKKVNKGGQQTAGGDSAEESVATLTAQDFEQIAMADLKNFKPAPIRTAADEQNDVKSLNRCLDRKLLLVVQSKFGQEFRWRLPMAILRPDENLRQAAERALKEINEQEQFLFNGNAPIGHLKVKHPKPVQSRISFIGMKIFFYKAQLRSRNLEVNPKKEHIQDYQWLTYDYLKPVLSKPMYKSVKHLLLE